MMEKTLLIIKPDAVSKNYAGKILDRILEEGFRICAIKMIKFSRRDAEKFYAEHKGKIFYKPLVEFMSSNPSIVAVLSRKNAIKRLRKVVGATNPANAEKGSLRKEFAQDGRHNAVHASDSLSSAEREISFLFTKKDIFNWKKKRYPLIK